MDRLSLMLVRVGQVIRTLMLREARDTHLTPVQIQTLLFVRHTKSFATSISRLALQLGASHASTVGVVDGLVAHGYLERITSSKDRRVTLLRRPRRERTSVTSWATGANHSTTWLGRCRARIASTWSGAWGKSWCILSTRVFCRGRALSRMPPFRARSLPRDPLPHYCHFLQEGISEVEASKDCPDFAITVA